MWACAYNATGIMNYHSNTFLVLFHHKRSLIFLYWVMTNAIECDRRETAHQKPPLKS